MKILVTGSGTLIGNTISTYLAKQKHKVIASYNNTIPKNLNKVKNISVVKFDLKRKLNIKDKKIDVLVHCASAIPSQSLSKKEMLEINYLGFKNLLKQSLKLKCKKIILLSTMSVYGKIKTNVISEQTSRNNQDSYGLSKFKMEQYLKKNSKKYNLNYAIFRLPGVIGYKSNHNFLSEKIKKIRNNEQIKISNPNFLFNNVVHVKNLAIIVSESLRLENEKATYNLGSNNKIKLKDILKLIYQILKKKPKIEIIKNKSKGFNINIKKILSKNYTLFDTEKSIRLFAKEHL
tara:strand:+ start:9609 stop:10478 length:870 start_codon:yes stop_codon:yes gene_type:complete